ncbi:stage V sporulation protein SpoVM [Amphibacillus sp. Q70]
MRFYTIKLPKFLGGIVRFFMGSRQGKEQKK